MMKRALEKELRRLGWWLDRHGGKHDIWTDGAREAAIPGHRELNERLARAILKRRDHDASRRNDHQGW
ncbi:TPA: toxin-antitoxin system, toxin component, HicA family protein [Candidatus Latescibacteria bacterium]|nr:toxin-antitoxin system, toxin component, HicA family protein [Candidatus Latescibacterota bacterium]